MNGQRYCAAVFLLGVLAVAAPLSAQDASGNSSKHEQERKLIAVLRSKAPLFDKARACQQLSVIGTARAVPALAALLGDERLGDYARIAMEPMDEPSVDDAFRKALGSLKGKLLAGVINSIGVRRDARAVPHLSKLAGDLSSGVAAEALAALGRIPTDAARRTLRKALTAGSPEIRRAAADACLAAAEYLQGRRQTTQAAAIYDAVAQAKVPPQFVAAATYHRIVRQGKAGVPLLIQHLRGPNPVLRKAALRAARAMPAREVTAALAAELRKSRPPLQALLIDVLAEREAPEAVAAIAAVAMSGAPEVRDRSLEALGRIGGASVVPVLLKAAAGGRKEAAIARRSLRTIEGDGVDAAILAGMKAAKGKLRAELIDVLADRRCAAAVRPLLGEAADADQNVAQAAFRALGLLAEPKDIPAMLRLLLAAKSDSTLSKAEAAIAAVAAKADNPAKRAEPVLAALASAKRPAARASLIRVLGRIGGADACRAVAKAIGGGNAAVADAAVRALAAWPDTHAAPTLLNLARAADNAAHRILALRGYVRLLGLPSARSANETVRKYAEAMKLAKRSDTKKLVLSGVARVAHPDALEIILPCLDDAAVGDEAAAAAVSIARVTMGAARKQARAAMAKVAAAAKGKPIAAEAQRIIRRIDRFGDALTAWRVAGPYLRPGLKYDKLFDVPFAPETPDAKGVAWQILPAGTDPKRPSILDLKKALGGTQRVAYALTWIHSAEAQPARLELGSDDGVKAWLNGRLVHANNAARAAVAYSDKADVTLKPGWNPLLLKITQNNLTWAFCARLAPRQASKPLVGIRVDCLHEGNWRLPRGSAPPTPEARK